MSTIPNENDTLSPEHRDRLQQWVDALLSDQYQQGRGYLRSDGVTESGRDVVTHCCLGVLGDMCPDVRWGEHRSRARLTGWFGDEAMFFRPTLLVSVGFSADVFNEDNSQTYLVRAAAEWVGYDLEDDDDGNESLDAQFVNYLMEANDGGQTFGMIAAIIAERHDLDARPLDQR